MLEGLKLSSICAYAPRLLPANDLSPVASSDLTGLRVLLAIPSLDTPVCDLEVRTFNTKAAELPGVSVYAVSMDS
jgi:thiol peroxidase